MIMEEGMLFITLPHMLEDIARRLEDRGMKWDEITSIPFQTYTQEDASKLTSRLYMAVGLDYVITAPADTDDPQWVIKFTKPPSGETFSKIEFIGERTDKANYALWIAFHTAKCTDRKVEKEHFLAGGTILNAS